MQPGADQLPGGSVNSLQCRQLMRAAVSSDCYWLFLCVFLVCESFNSMIVVVFWGSHSQIIVTRIVPAKLIKHIPNVKEISEAAV